MSTIVYGCTLLCTVVYISSCTIPEQCGQDILLGYQVVSQGGNSEQLEVGSDNCG